LRGLQKTNWDLRKNFFISIVKKFLIKIESILDFIIMAKTVTEELVFEYWDCDKCGQKAIRGDIRNCPSCGNPRSENIKFYLLEGKEEKVEDTVQAEKFKAGADWVCSFCEALNSVTDKNCLSCGASQESSEKNYFEVQKEKELKATKSTETEKPADWWEVKYGKPFNWMKFNIWTVLILGSCISSLYYLGKSHEVKFQVVDVAWERTIPIMRFTNTEKTDWEDELKGEEIVKLKSSQEIRSYEDRQVGTKMETYDESEQYQSGTRNDCSTSYESTGSGASKKVTSCNDVPTYSSRTVQRTRQVPVYQKFPIFGTKVIYTANIYLPLREDTTKGKNNDPLWPEPTLGAGVNGKEDKKGEPKASYIVELKKVNPEDKAKDIYRIKTTEDKFKNFYILNKSVIRPVNVFKEIDLEDGEEKIDETEKEK